MKNQSLFRPPENKDSKSSTQTMISIDQKDGKKRFISMPDRLGLSSRLSLYDARRQFILGEPAGDQVSYRPIKVNDKVVGYLGLKPVLDQDDALSINFF